MRRVKRPAAPTSLSQKKALDERQAALDFYAAWDGTTKYDDYKVYKNPDIRAELEKAFGGKCAYCETYYAATQPVAIEHYRPKGEVTIGGKRVPPGYYWLASEWTNLLPSCTDCNSPRKQDLPDDTRTAGKANAFPLASEASRATTPGGEKREKRLLLCDVSRDRGRLCLGTSLTVGCLMSSWTVGSGWGRASRGGSWACRRSRLCVLVRR